MKKILKGLQIIMAGALLLILATGCGSGHKFVCKSPEGSITISYNDSTITGYSANGISFDLEGQKEVARQLGVEGYMDSFEIWFTGNTSGSCERK